MNDIIGDSIRHDVRRLTDDKLTGIIDATQPTELRKPAELIDLVFNTTVNKDRRVRAFCSNKIKDTVAILYRKY